MPSFILELVGRLCLLCICLVLASWSTFRTTSPSQLSEPKEVISNVDVTASGANTDATWNDANTDLGLARALAQTERIIWIVKDLYRPSCACHNHGGNRLVR